MEETEALKESMTLPWAQPISNIAGLKSDPEPLFQSLPYTVPHPMASGPLFFLLGLGMGWDLRWDICPRQGPSAYHLPEPSDCARIAVGKVKPFLTSPRAMEGHGSTIMGSTF